MKLLANYKSEHTSYTKLSMDIPKNLDKLIAIFLLISKMIMVKLLR